MSGTTERLAGTPHEPQEITQPLSFDLPSAPARSSNSLPSWLTYPEEPITMSTIHDMLIRILEQTNALCDAQTSTNHTLDELRQSIPAAQENTEFDERLRHVEALTEVLARSQRVEQHPPPGRPTRTTTNPNQGGSHPQASSQHSSAQSGDGAFTRGAAVNPPDSINMATEITPSPLHASGGNDPRLEPSVHVRNKEDVAEEAPATVPLLNRVDQPTTDPIASPENIFPPETQQPAVTPFPSTTQADGDRPLGVPDLPLSPTSHASRDIEDIPRHEPIEETKYKLTPIPPRRDSDEAPINLIQSNAQDSIARCDLGPLDREVNYIGKNASFEGELAHARIEPDVKRDPTKNMSQVMVSDGNTPCKQVPDLANLVRQMLVAYGEQKASVEQQWSKWLHWKEGSDRHIGKLIDMVSWLVEERREEMHNISKTNPEEYANTKLLWTANEHVMEELHRSYAEHRELVTACTDVWRADSERHNEEIINTVRATANEQVPFNVQGYLDEFSKTLSTEVRMLLGEVGKLREERRSIQHEIGYLLTMQSTFAPGGEFGTDWPPEYSSPHVWPSPAGIPLPESPRPHSGWRAVSVQRGRRVSRPEPPPPPEMPLYSWATWQPSSALAPTPPSVEPTLLVPERGSPGLFGPRSPRDSPRDSHSPGPGQPSAPGRRAPSWVTWKPNPTSLAGPNPTSRDSKWRSWGTQQPNAAWTSAWSPAEPGSGWGDPGLFGPRSPRGSPRVRPKKNENPDSDSDSWGGGVGWGDGDGWGDGGGWDTGDQHDWSWDESGWGSKPGGPSR